jgi:deoxyribodipyrimidine photolyase-related protein
MENNMENTKTLTLILGDQLFFNHTSLNTESDYLMLESVDFNTTFKYHKSRILHCFVAMREYCDYLKTFGKKVHYFNYEAQQNLESVFELMFKTKGAYTTLQVASIDDKYFKQVIIDLCKNKNIKLEILASPKFINNQEHWCLYKSKYPKRLFMNDFYIMQRKRLGIMLDSSGNSSLEGAKWSLDQLNRNKLPKTEAVENRTTEFYTSKHQPEVELLIKKHFANNAGQLGKIYFPINRAQALEHLENFGKKYFSKFGDYEDALSSRDPFLFHSTISPLLNNGLLTPLEVINWAIKLKEVPDNSKEGFIRQIIGWREWVNSLYWNVYNQPLSEYNFFKHTKTLPDYFWDQTKLQSIKDNTPLYNALANVFEFGYCHHIERLMVISNWMVLNEYDPQECYKWFMTMFIDSYEWVMVANVFGMGLFADGGVFATKPYVAGGNYLKKMSDYPDHKNWEKTWTDLFWNFLLKHEEFFKTNPRMAMLISGYKKRSL